MTLRTISIRCREECSLCTHISTGCLKRLREPTAKRQGTRRSTHKMKKFLLSFRCLSFDVVLLRSGTLFCCSYGSFFFFFKGYFIGRALLSLVIYIVEFYELCSRYTFLLETSFFFFLNRYSGRLEVFD